MMCFQGETTNVVWSFDVSDEYSNMTEKDDAKQDIKMRSYKSR